MNLQHQKDLAIAIAAILAIAVILAITVILAISRLIEKPQLSCATLLEEVVLNYIYSKLRTRQRFFARQQCSIFNTHANYTTRWFQM